MLGCMGRRVLSNSHPKGVYIRIPRAYDYVPYMAKEIQAVDKIKFTHQISLK